MTAGGTLLLPLYKGREVRELPEPRRRDRFRISLAEAAGL
jgi:hypothetical protein